ncbi:MAG: DUF262 domain-containing HNH endonuclease family protein [Treponemataceae bacterium]
MKTENHSIEDVLSRNATSFFIPPFQRSYAWGKPEITRYFDDIKKIIASELDENVRDKQEHFFGTLVLKKEINGIENRLIIVDGQQRLTTTLLFLIALRDTETKTENKTYVTNNYLKNNASNFEDKIKLKQVSRDWEAYKALVNNDENVRGNIYKAYELFKKLITEAKQNNPKITFENFITAIQRINVAVIFLDERPFKGEDPQIIFETLNSLGKPLTLSDLIRNFILLDLDSESQTKLYENTWYPKIEAVLTENTSKFFRDYLQAKKMEQLKVVSDNNTKELYRIFKDYVNEKFEDKKIFIKDIVPYVIWYKWIITEVNTDTISTNKKNNETIKELLRNIFHDIKADAFKPFCLCLLEKYANKSLDDENLISILFAIRTYLIRRRLCGLAQGENKHIVILCRKVPNLVSGEVSIFELLSSISYRLRLPNDNEIKKQLSEMNFYEGMKRYNKFILGKIEEHNSKVAVDFRKSEITIEHIMPQTLNDEWERELGKNFLAIHNNYLHNIGNLILTEFNSEIGNQSFTKKKNKLQNSTLSYRRDILKMKTWNKQSILEHQKNMAAYFCKTFPLPDKYKNANNWDSSIIERSTFSPMDDDIGEIVTGNRPAQIRIFDKLIQVNSWQDVFIALLNYLKEKTPDDFAFILDNQYELFGREATVITRNSLNYILEDNISYTKRYKTFSGSFLDEARDSNNELYIHINCSAEIFMIRIRNIMEKLSIDSDDIEIKLKEN